MLQSHVTIIAKIYLFIPAHRIGLGNEKTASDNPTTIANVNMFHDFRVFVNCQKFQMNTLIVICLQYRYIWNWEAEGRKSNFITF